MGIFDYKQDGNSSEIVKEAAIVQSYAWETSGETVTFNGEGGWKVLTAQDLNYYGFTNEYNEFFGESLLFLSAESNILGKYDENGKLVSIGISFWGTGTRPDDANFLINTLLDAVMDASAALVPGSANYYVYNAFNNLMTCVKDFAQANGLTGDDVIVTGHSLGGMAVNSMATLSAWGHWDGFYENASYVAFASPTQNTVDDKVLNIGYENDPVFRILDGQSLTNDSLVYHDQPIEGATNNIVNFNEFYAGLKGLTGFQSLLNPDSWSAHSGSGYYDGTLRILNSEAYKYTHLDSTVIVSTLSEELRSSVIVQDFHRSPVEHTGTTFLIGTETSDIIRGGNGNDYLSGLEGNDTFILSGGYDVIYGGSGENTVQLAGSLADYSIAKGNSDELYFKNNTTGMITKASNIAGVSVQSATSADSAESYTVQSDGIAAGETTVSYAQRAFSLFDTLYATNGDNQWVFIEDNRISSMVFNTGKDNTIVSSNHTDLIYNFNQKDTTLIFSQDFGNDFVFDLNSSSSLVFMENEYIAANDSYLNHVTYLDGYSVLTVGNNSVTLMGVNEAMLSEMNIQFV